MNTEELTVFARLYAAGFDALEQMDQCISMFRNDHEFVEARNALACALGQEEIEFDEFDEEGVKINNEVEESK